MPLNTAISSGLLNSGTTTVLFEGKAHLNSLQLILDGTQAGTVTVYDNTAASGKIIGVFNGVAATSGESIVYVNPVRCDIGLTVLVSVTAQAIVTYNA